MREGWEEVELERYINLIDYRGRTPEKTASGVRLITAKNVKLGYLEIEPQEFIAEDNYETWMSRGIPNKGDVIFTTEAPLANVAQIPNEEKVAFAQRIIVMQPDSGKISQDFLKYMLLSPEVRTRILSNGTGATVIGIKSKLLRKIPIFIPPISEQKQIVAKLDKAFAAIDRAKANIERNIENAKELFQSKLNEIFSQKGEGWEEKRLGEVCEKMQYGTSSKSETSGEVAVLRMGNIQDCQIEWVDLKYTNNINEIDKFKLEKDDVLFNRTNSPELVGKTAIYKGFKPAIYAGYLINVKYKRNILNGYFLNYFLNSQKIRDYGYSVMSSSVNQANISASKLKEYIINFPSLREQEIIAKDIKELKNKQKILISKYQKKIDSLENLKNSILQKAFHGEL